MGIETISAKTTDSEPVEVQYDLGDDLQDAVAKFGEDVVFSRFKAATVIDLQSFMRSKIRSAPEGEEVDPTSIQEAVAEWAPGVRQSRGKSSEEKARDAVNKLTPEVRAALLAELQSGAGEEEAA